jgi:hypothetical protein
MYDNQIGRWDRSDSKAELYFATSPYVYALNQPTNAIDPDGNVVIFIGGNNFGATGHDYWTDPNYYTMRAPLGTKPPNDYHQYGSYGDVAFFGKDRSFDNEVMKKLNDPNARYYDGSEGGWHPAGDFYRNSASALGRWKDGEAQGFADAKDIIEHLARDKNNNIVETIKVITHSMGGAYGNGFVAGLQQYITELPRVSPQIGKSYPQRVLGCA